MEPVSAVQAAYVVGGLFVFAGLLIFIKLILSSPEAEEVEKETTPKPRLDVIKPKTKPRSGLEVSKEDFFVLARKYPDITHRALVECWKTEMDKTGDSEGLALAVALMNRHLLGEEIAEKFGVHFDLGKEKTLAPLPEVTQ